MAPKKDAKKENKPKKVAVDHTFGLKNKNKSKKVQDFVQQVQKNVANSGISKAEAKRLKELKAAKDARMAEKAAKEERANLLKPVLAGGVAGSVDNGEENPKDSICKFFLQGACARGDKCKYSHSLQQSRAQKINLYMDPRDMDTMDTWDQKKLEEVVEINEQSAEKRSNQTEIVCKYFLDAIENNKYGWRWKCPNGESCIYRHRLPQGFVFRPKGSKVEEEEEEELPLEERIEEQRRVLDLAKCTPVTAESFKAWYAKQRQKKADAVEQERKKAAKKGGNRGLHALSGHALFQYDRSLFQNQNLDDGDAVFDLSELRRDLDDEKEEDDQQGSAEGPGAINPSLFLADDLDV